jgi:hypothetical protein
MTTARQRLGKKLTKITLSTAEERFTARQRLANTRFTSQRISYYGLNTHLHSNKHG